MNLGKQRLTDRTGEEKVQTAAQAAGNRRGPPATLRRRGREGELKNEGHVW